MKKGCFVFKAGLEEGSYAIETNPIKRSSALKNGFIKAHIARKNETRKIGIFFKMPT